MQTERSITVIAICPDCNEAFHPDQLTAVSRAKPGRSWRAVTRICAKCLPAAREQGATISG